ncbi:MAG: SRPBCC family protein [Polyangiaceae bacterium]
MRAEAEATIAAPIDRVWQRMVDVDRYADWNPFILRVEGGNRPLRVGDEFILHVRLAGRITRSREQISKLDGPSGPAGARRAALVYVYRGLIDRLGMVHGSRTQELLETERGTRYHTYEDFSGWATWALPIGAVRDGFRAHADALASGWPSP